MPKFRKKPVVIEAEQFLSEKDPKDWPKGVMIDKDSPTGYSIETMENTTHGQHVTHGDFIITGVKNEKYPCKPDIFEQTYEPVED